MPQRSHTIVLACLVGLSLLAPCRRVSAQKKYSSAEETYQLGNKQKSQGKNEDAIRTFTYLARKHPKHNRAGCGLVYAAQIHMRLGDYDSAVKVFKQVRSRHGHCNYTNGVNCGAMAAYYLSLCYAKQGEADKAKRAYEAAAKTYPAAISHDKTSLKDWAGRRLLFYIAQPAHPDDKAAEGLYHAGKKKKRAQDFEEAIAIFTELKKRYPKHNRTGCGLLEMAGAQVSLGKYDEAIQTFREILAQYAHCHYGNGLPVAQFAVYQISICHHSMGRAEEAKQAFAEAVKQFPNARFESGRPIQEYYRNRLTAPAGAFRNDAGERLYQTGIKQWRERQYEAAVKTFAQISDKYPNHNRAGCGLASMGRILMGQHRYDEAIEAFRKTLANNPGSRYEDGVSAAAVAAYYISMCHHRMGEIDKAAESLEKALAAYPEAVSHGGKKLQDIVLEAMGEPRQAPKIAVKDEAGKARHITGSVAGIYRQAAKLEKQKPNEAIRLYGELIAEYPEHNRAGCALARIADLLGRQKRYDEAIANSCTVLELHPESRYANGALVAAGEAFKIGYFHYLKKDMPQAKRAFDRAREKYGKERGENGTPWVETYGQAMKEVDEAVRNGR